MKSKNEIDNLEQPNSGFSGRGFMKGVGLSSGVIGAAVMTPEEAEAATTEAQGPGPVSYSLRINGKPTKVTLEPRVTLLDAMRNHLDITGAKRVCDRGTCGACTVIMNGKPVYACSVLAIDAQGANIQTIEGLGNHPIVQAFVNNDAQQCGYCTPGFVMASKAFLDSNPKPTYDQVKDGLGGNLCRCGTYVGVRKAVLEASKRL